MKAKVKEQEADYFQQAENIITLIVQKAKYKVKAWILKHIAPIVFFPCLTLFFCGILLFAYLTN
jgi:hypothetical protein